MPTSAQPPSLYAKLGLVPEATAAQVDATFLRLALQHHPLKHPGDGLMQQRYAQLVHAYFILGSAEERARYDAAQANGTAYRPNGRPPALDQAFLPLFRQQAAQLLPEHGDAAALCAALLAKHYPMALAKQLADELTAPVPAAKPAAIEPVMSVQATAGEQEKPAAPIFTPAPSFGAKPQPKAAAKVAKDDYQPYAPPKSVTTPRSEAMVWREGKMVVVAAGSDFPHRCVRCNADVATPSKQRTYYWHSPWLLLIALINLLIYAIIAMIVRRKVKVSPALCKTHQAGRNRIILGIWAGVALSVGLAVVGGVEDSAGLFALSMLALLITAIFGCIKGPLLRAKRIDTNAARFSGAGTAFLDGLPQR
ncbi:J domain-containing protein [Chitinimonas sp.]|uniref:J domain-containing protein n=1 Tax=Chitinimonas sp. TaxID=1934313 RepID=UPI002F95FA6A